LCAISSETQRHHLSLSPIDLYIQHSSLGQEQAQQRRQTAISRQAQPPKHSSTYIQSSTNTSISLPGANMCLITTPRKESRYHDSDPPRPVSNFTGGRRSSAAYRPSGGYSRRSVSRTRVIEAEPRRSARSMDYDYVRVEPRHSGRNLDYTRTSRTYVR